MSETTTTAPVTLTAAETQAANIASTGAMAVLSAPAGSEPSWAKPAISILSLLIFIALIVVAFLRGDTTGLAILSGVGAGMAQQVAGYYLGSSAGSAKKPDLLAAAPPVTPAT